MADGIKLTEKSKEVFDYVKANGGRVSIEELATALNRTPRSVNANVTDLCSEKKGLCVREKVAAQAEGEKDITYVVLTEAGQTFTADAE